MRNQKVKWEVVAKPNNHKPKKSKNEEIVDILLRNRGIKTKKQKEEFFNPLRPEKLVLKELGINKQHLEKALVRIKSAIENGEKIIVYGDYDADGICATAILWETLYYFTKKVRPYIPDRFEDGYGLNVDSVSKLKSQNPQLKLIITVDNGIVAHEAIKKANELGIDVIVSDHHQKEKKLPRACAIVHTGKISGSGVAWILAREILKKLKNPSTKLRASSKTKEQKNKIARINSGLINSKLELCAVGTIADQMPLVGPNRSFAKWGLEVFNKTKRKGLLAIFKEAGIGTSKRSALKGTKIGTYEVNFIIAPRINAMGRLEHAIDSLRLLCTNNTGRARELAGILGRTNRQRQAIVDEVLLHARQKLKDEFRESVIVLAHETYHEGVIGLAASKLVEEFWRPAVVFSKGEKVSKASARSISGFDMISAIKSLDSMIIGGGGHPMAAGFSIKTAQIKLFKKEFVKLADSILSKEILKRKLRIDFEVKLSDLSRELMKIVGQFEPFGIGNPTPVFSTKNVTVVDARVVGSNAKHLKLSVEKNGCKLNAIAFGMGGFFPKLKLGKRVDIAYNLDWDFWNGKDALQLKIKDLKVLG